MRNIILRSRRATGANVSTGGKQSCVSTAENPFGVLKRETCTQLYHHVPLNLHNQNLQADFDYLPAPFVSPTTFPLILITDPPL